jgi:hypothetical protein
MSQKNNFAAAKKYENTGAAENSRQTSYMRGSLSHFSLDN